MKKYSKISPNKAIKFIENWVSKCLMRRLCLLPYYFSNIML